MINKIHSCGASHTPQVSLKDPIAPCKLPHCDTLILSHGKSGSFVQTLYKRVKKWLVTIYSFLFSMLTPIVYFRSKSINASLETLGTLKQELSEKGSTSSRNAIRHWWKDQYQSLHPTVQKWLLIQDIKQRAEDRKGIDREKWAEENYQSHKAQAEAFVVDLQVKTESGYRHDPLDDIPRYIDNILLAKYS